MLLINTEAKEAPKGRNVKTIGTTHRIKVTFHIEAIKRGLHR